MGRLRFYRHRKSPLTIHKQTVPSHFSLDVVKSLANIRDNLLSNSFPKETLKW